MAAVRNPLPLGRDQASLTNSPSRSWVLRWSPPGLQSAAATRHPESVPQHLCASSSSSVNPPRALERWSETGSSVLGLSSVMVTGLHAVAAGSPFCLCPGASSLRRGSSTEVTVQLGFVQGLKQKSNPKSPGLFRTESRHKYAADQR